MQMEVIKTNELTIIIRRMKEKTKKEKQELKTET